MNCPVCNNPHCDEVAEEVDIGVGTLRQVTGYDCPECGQIPVCQACGGIGAIHREHCKDMLEILNAPEDEEPPL